MYAGFLKLHSPDRIIENMKKRKNMQPNVTPGRPSGSRLFPALIGTGIFLSAATVVTSLFVYFNPGILDSNTSDNISTAADAAVSPATAILGPYGTMIPASGNRLPGLEALAIDTLLPDGAETSGSDTVSPSGEGDGDSQEPHELGELSDLDMEAFVTEEGIVYSSILDTSIGPMIYYSQGDARWRDFLYGGADPMKKYGCGPTAVAMLISSFSLEGSSVTPQDMAQWAAANGQYASHSGSYHSLIPEALAAYGLRVESVQDRSPENVRTLLTSGHILVALMGRGSLTENGHFVLITRMQDNGYVSIADPNRYENCKKDWDLEALLSELKPNFDSGGPLWAVSTG